MKELDRMIQRQQQINAASELLEKRGMSKAPRAQNLGQFVHKLQTLPARLLWKILTKPYQLVRDAVQQSQIHAAQKTLDKDMRAAVKREKAQERALHRANEDFSAAKEPSDTRQQTVRAADWRVISAEGLSDVAAAKLAADEAAALTNILNNRAFMERVVDDPNIGAADKADVYADFSQARLGLGAASATARSAVNGARVSATERLTRNGAVVNPQNASVKLLALVHAVDPSLGIAGKWLIAEDKREISELDAVEANDELAGLLNDPVTGEKVRAAIASSVSSARDVRSLHSVAWMVRHSEGDEPSRAAMDVSGAVYDGAGRGAAVLSLSKAADVGPGLERSRSFGFKQ